MWILHLDSCGCICSRRINPHVQILVKHVAFQADVVYADVCESRKGHDQFSYVCKSVLFNEQTWAKCPLRTLCLLYAYIVFSLWTFQDFMR